MRAWYNGQGSQGAALRVDRLAAAFPQGPSLIYCECDLLVWGGAGDPSRAREEAIWKGAIPRKRKGPPDWWRNWLCQGFAPHGAKQK